MDTQPDRKKLDILWRVYTKVKAVEEHFEQFNWRRDPASGQTTFDQRSLGFFVHFEGSYEALFFGMEKPDISPGDEFVITFEKAKKQ